MSSKTDHYTQTKSDCIHAPKKRCARAQYTQGFTITELLVSIGIMLIITSVLLVRYSSFNSAVLLKSQALEVALAIREAQLYAVASQGDTGDFNKRYGVFFDTGSLRYLLYRDEDNNGRYTESSNDVVLGSYQLDDRFEIRGMVDDDDGGTDVTSGNDVLSVAFRRPNFDAIFYTADNNPLPDSVVYIEVVLAGESGNENDVLRTVEVTSAGQITVQ